LVSVLFRSEKKEKARYNRQKNRASSQMNEKEPPQSDGKKTAQSNFSLAEVADGVYGFCLFSTTES
jgi:hypothetical protein